MWYVLSYIHHFLASNSRHGTHSPFVYALADQVIYNRDNKKIGQVEFPAECNLKYKPLLNKILVYLSITKVSKDDHNTSADAYWICSPEDMDVEKVLNAVKGGKLVILDEPYKRAHRKFWRTMIKDPRVIVSINLFHFGIVLHREGQYKEDFLLRYTKISAIG